MVTGRQGKGIGISRVLANSNPVWKRAWKIIVYYLPYGWTGIGEDIRFMVEALKLPPPKLSEQAWGGLVSRAGIGAGLLEFVFPIVTRQMVDPKGHARTSQVLRRTRLMYGNPTGRRISPMFDLGERIKQVRAIEEEIKRREKAFEESLKDFVEFAETGRAEILEFLNATGQKSANTPYGTAYWKEKVTYRVQDKQEFRSHVIGAEAWELVTWGAAGVAAEEFTNEHGEPPPGCVRNAVNILYLNAPAKPRVKVAKAEEGDDEPDDLPKAAE